MPGHPHYPELAGAQGIRLEFRPALLPPAATLEGEDRDEQLLLMAEDVEHFNEFGFTRPITVFSGEALVALQRRFAGYSSGGQAERVAKWRDPRHWLDVCAHGPTLAIAQALVGSENVVCHVSQFIDKGPASTGTAASFGHSADVFHQDASFNAMDSGSIVVWLALADADETNGAMLCLPGSHLHGLLPCAQDGPAGGGIDGGGHSVDLSALPPSLRRTAPVPLRARAGQCIVLSDMLMHSSPPNPSPTTRLRPALTATYAAAELRVWDSEFPVVVGGVEGAAEHWAPLPAAGAPSAKI